MRLKFRYETMRIFSVKWQEFTQSTLKINFVFKYILEIGKMFIFWKACEKFVLQHTSRKKLEVPIKNFEAYQPIFYLNKSNKMKKVSFSLSIVEFDISSYFTSIFFSVLLNWNLLCKLSAKVILLKNGSWLCTMANGEKGLNNNHFLSRLMLRRYFLLHLKAIMRNFFNFKKVFIFFPLKQGVETLC